MRFRLSKIGFILLLISSKSYAHLDPDPLDEELNADNAIATTLVEALKNGSPTLGLRLQYEHFDTHQEGIKDAYAATLRTQIGYLTSPYCDTVAHIEMTHVANFNHQFNSGVAKIGDPNRALIPDPKGAGLSLAHLTYSGIEETSLEIGRQMISLDNERFVGLNDFRQYPQRFDAIFLETEKGIPDTQMTYAYIKQFNTNQANTRINEGRRNQQTHLANLRWDGPWGLNVTGYGYWIHDRTVATDSNTTFGIRAQRINLIDTSMTFHGVFEYAHQQGRFDNPSHYQAHYYLAELGFHTWWAHPVIGYEVLTGSHSDPLGYFKTPLGSNHDFQGWFDFWETYSERSLGLRDLYLKGFLTLYRYKLELAYHYFQSDKSTKRIADELDCKISTELGEHCSVEFAIAHLFAKNSIDQGTKCWLTAKVSL